MSLKLRLRLTTPDRVGYSKYLQLTDVRPTVNRWKWANNRTNRLCRENLEWRKGLQRCDFWQNTSYILLGITESKQTVFRATYRQTKNPRSLTLVIGFTRNQLAHPRQPRGLPSLKLSKLQPTGPDIVDM